MIIPLSSLFLPWSLKNKPLPKNFVTSDRDYFCPTRDMVFNEIAPKYWQWLSSLNLTKWAHRWDCDNFADAFKLFSCGYYQQAIESTANGIAVGVINYVSISRTEDNRRGGHAINIIYVNDGKKDDGTDNIGLLFLEPQTCEVKYLTEEEFNSIWTVYI